MSTNTLAASKPPLLSLFTNGGDGSSASWSVPEAGYSANEQLVDVLTCNTMTADGSGGVSASTSNGMPMVRPPSPSHSHSERERERR